MELRPVAPDDAALIVQLRAGASAEGKLHAGASNEMEQRQWLVGYFERHQRHAEHYFIILHRSNAVGAVRIYNVNAQTGSFTWGSWVMMKGTDPSVAWMSAITVYDYAFDTLGLVIAQFEVVAQNKSVVRFHRIFGADVVRQTEAFVDFSLSKERYRLVREKFLRLVAGGVSPS